MQVELTCRLKNDFSAALVFDWARADDHDWLLDGSIHLSIGPYTHEGPFYAEGYQVRLWIEELEAMTTQRGHEALFHDWDGLQRVWIRNTALDLSPVRVSYEWHGFVGVPDPDEAGGEVGADGAYLSIRGLRAEIAELATLIERLRRLLGESKVRTDYRPRGLRPQPQRGD